MVARMEMKVTNINATVPNKTSRIGVTAFLELNTPRNAMPPPTPLYSKSTQMERNLKTR
ncbi:hypothetical protein ES703_50393 [subsurface metagenome]